MYGHVVHSPALPRILYEPAPQGARFAEYPPKLTCRTPSLPTGSSTGASGKLPAHCGGMLLIHAHFTLQGCAWLRAGQRLPPARAGSVTLRVLTLTPVPHSCSPALLSKTVSLHAAHTDQPDTAQSCLGAGVGWGTNLSQLGSSPDHCMSLPQVRVTDADPPATLNPFAQAKVIVAPGPRPALPLPRVDAETRPCSGVFGGGHSRRATQ